MKVRLHSVTPDAEASLIEVARVSSSRENKREDYERLIRYLIKHGHWSPFEHAYMTVEIETSKAIAIQLLRHRSFTFQEFSQRYQDVSVLGEMFEPIELRRQAESNRQSSTEPLGSLIFIGESSLISDNDNTDSSERELLSRASLIFDDIRTLYEDMLASGIARETARMILPMATKTKLYMTGNLRSWIHFLSIRDDSHAQKEIQLVAKEIKKIFREQFPETSRALWHDDGNETPKTGMGIVIRNLENRAAHGNRKA